MLLDRDEPGKPFRPFKLGGWILLFLCWCVLAANSRFERVPDQSPLGAIAIVVVVIMTLLGCQILQDRRERIPYGSSRWLVFWTAAIAVAAVVAAVAACWPSMGSGLGGEQFSEYALSTTVAPGALALTFIVALAALRSLSLRRIGFVIVTSILLWPLLWIIAKFRGPLFDVDGDFVLLAPWAVFTYFASLAAMNAFAIALMLTAQRIAARPPASEPLAEARVVVARG